jgi:hypothetical protein
MNRFDTVLEFSCALDQLAHPHLGLRFAVTHTFEKFDCTCVGPGPIDKHHPDASCAYASPSHGKGAILIRFLPSRTYAQPQNVAVFPSAAFVFVSCSQRKAHSPAFLGLRVSDGAFGKLPL